MNEIRHEVKNTYICVYVFFLENGKSYFPGVDRVIYDKNSREVLRWIRSKKFLIRLLQIP